MVLDFNRLFEVEGESVPLKYSLDLSDVEQWGIKPFESPVEIEGIVCNRTGIVTLTYTAEFSTTVPCDRCTESIAISQKLEFTHKLIAKLYNEDPDSDYVEVPTGKLDFKELATADLILELPNKYLCGDDCKGICMVCGANLNNTSCGCATKEVDPRLAKLLSLLD